MDVAYALIGFALGLTVAATVLGIAKAINSCNMIINAPMNAIICNTDAKVLTATAA